MSATMPRTLFTPAIQPPRPAAPQRLPQRPPTRQTGQRDQLKLSTRAATFDLKDLKAGETYQVTGQIKGHSFKGTALVNEFDGRNVDLTIKGTVMLMRITVHARLETQANGTVHALAEQTAGPSLPGAPAKAETDLKVVSVKPDATMMRAPDGSTASVVRDARGTLLIDFLNSHVELKR